MVWYVPHQNYAVPDSGVGRLSWHSLTLLRATRKPRYPEKRAVSRNVGTRTGTSNQKQADQIAQRRSSGAYTACERPDKAAHTQLRRSVDVITAQTPMVLKVEHLPQAGPVGDPEGALGNQEVILRRCLSQVTRVCFSARDSMNGAPSNGFHYTLPLCSTVAFA